MAPLDKEKKQNAQENGNIDPLESKEQEGGAPDKDKEQNSEPDEHATLPTSDAVDKEEKPSELDEESSDSHTTSPDSLESQDGGHGDDYYTDSTLHTDIYSDDDSKPTAEGDAAEPSADEQETDAAQTSSGAGDGGGGGDDDKEKDPQPKKPCGILQPVN